MLLVVPAALAALTWLPRLEVDGGEIRYRGIRTSATMPLTSVDAVQLRRVPFGPLHGPARTYRFGRFASTPIRVQVISGGEAPIWVTALWWQDWPLLVRFLMTVPYVAVDSRTRGRLERYG